MHSDGGSRFAERMLPVSASCRQHGRNRFAFLVEAVTAPFESVFLCTRGPGLLIQPAL